MKLQIDYESLQWYLETLKHEDFKNGLIERGHAIDDIEQFKMDKSKIKLSSVIFQGDPFLVDVVGNDLSVVFLTKRKYRMPLTGIAKKCKFGRTIIYDCNRTFGSPLNGYWKIPDQFLKWVRE